VYTEADGAGVLALCMCRGDKMSTGWQYQKSLSFWGRLYACVHVCLCVCVHVCVDEAEVYFEDCYLTPLVSQVFVPELSVLRE